MQATRPSFEEPYLKLSSAWSFSKAFQSKSNVPCAKSITKERRDRPSFEAPLQLYDAEWSLQTLAIVLATLVQVIDQRSSHIKRKKIQGNNYYWLVSSVMYLPNEIHMNWTLWLVNYWYGLTFSSFFLKQRKRDKKKKKTETTIVYGCYIKGI